MLGIYTVFEVSSSLIALIASIATFYWKLYPIIKKMDNSGQITPEGYSKTLAMMISIFILMLSGALVVSLLFGI